MTWKNRIWALPLTILLLAGCANQVSQADYIGIDKAKEVALQAAGVSASDAAFTTAGLDRKDGTDFYAVDFTVDGQSYEYDVDAVTGVIISSSTGQTGPVPSASGGTSLSDTQTAAGTEGLLTEEEARAAALTHAGLSEQDVTFVKCRLEREDGRQVYDVEFVTADYQEYDYEIDPATGEVLSYDYDAESYVSTSGGSEITREEARRIALERSRGPLPRISMNSAWTMTTAGWSTRARSSMTAWSTSLRSTATAARSAAGRRSRSPTESGRLLPVLSLRLKRQLLFPARSRRPELLFSLRKRPARPP